MKIKLIPTVALLATIAFTAGLANAAPHPKSTNKVATRVNSDFLGGTCISGTPSTDGTRGPFYCGEYGESAVFQSIEDMYSRGFRVVRTFQNQGYTGNPDLDPNGVRLITGPLVYIIEKK